ncbi:MAG: hypothetical protein ABW026_11565, partial [Microvirga sp.]
MSDARADPRARAGMPLGASAPPALDIAAVTVLALVARIVWHLVVPVRDWPDTEVYLQTGHALLSTGLMSSANYMPVYPLAISLAGYGGIVPVQLVVSALCAGLVQVIAFDIFGSRRAALLSGLIAALYPPLVFYANMRLTETLYIALVLLAFASFHRGAFLAGSIALVASILTRPSLDLVAPFLIVAFCVARRETGFSTISRRLGLYGLVYVVLMAPWWWHNWLLYHAFVRLDVAMGNLLVIENSDLFDRVGLDFDALAPAWERFYGISDPIARDRAMVDAALDYIRNDPLHWLWRCADRFARFWSFVPGSQSRLVNVVSIATTLPVTALAILALVRLGVRRLRPVVPILLLVAYLTAIHTLTHGIPRYRLPLEPFLIVL